MAVQRRDILKQARTYLGVPFLHQGRTVHGLDCIGLAVRVAQDLGLTEADADGYSRVPSGRMMERRLRAECTQIPIEDAMPGDLYHMAFGDQPQHIALVTDHGIIHADNLRGVVEHWLDEQWRARIRGAYQMPGVESWPS